MLKYWITNDFNTHTAAVALNDKTQVTHLCCLVFNAKVPLGVVLVCSDTGLQTFFFFLRLTQNPPIIMHHKSTATCMHVSMACVTQRVLGSINRVCSHYAVHPPSPSHVAALCD